MGLDACMEWAGAKTRGGYGLRKVDGRLSYVHRLSYCEANSLNLDDIAGKVVRHRCDNPACFNPSHLMIGTQADNLRDMRERGRGRGWAPAGVKNPSVKLNEDEVRFVLKHHVPQSREWGASALAKRFGVSESRIGHIVNGKAWRHLMECSNAA